MISHPPESSIPNKISYNGIEYARLTDHDVFFELEFFKPYIFYINYELGQVVRTRVFQNGPPTFQDYFFVRDFLKDLDNYNRNHLEIFPDCFVKNKFKIATNNFWIHFALKKQLEKWEYSFVVMYPNTMPSATDIRDKLMWIVFPDELNSIRFHIQFSEYIKEYDYLLLEDEDQ